MCSSASSRPWTLGEARPYYWLLLAESHLTRRLFGSMAPANLGPAVSNRLTVQVNKERQPARHQSGEVSEKRGGTEPIPVDSRPGRVTALGSGRWRVDNQRTADSRLARV